MSKVKKKSLILLTLVFTLSFFFMHGSAPKTMAVGEPTAISTSAELAYYAVESQKEGNQNIF